MPFGNDLAIFSYETFLIRGLCVYLPTVPTLTINMAQIVISFKILFCVSMCLFNDR